MIGCFGKVPASADFVSLHGAAEEVCEFDTWLQGALSAMQHREDWRELFDRLPVCLFSYRARNGNCLLGGMISSRDSSARRYPFFIFQTLKASDVQPLVNPFTLSELFCAQIKPLLHMAAQGESSAVLFERIKALRPLQAQDFELFRRVHHKFLMNFNLRDITRSLEDSYPEFVSNAVLTRLLALQQPMLHKNSMAISLPLPAERGLKNPTADLWIDWLTRMKSADTAPQISMLMDDFMRPKLLCFASRNSNALYRVLTGTSERLDNYDVLAPFDAFDEHHRVHAFPAIDCPLYDVIDRFVDALDLKSV
ncbi:MULTISPECIES: type VI secretion system-associated protein TagF [Pseudomonas]|uniref:type VI secretion system-associated protein TagF n=1 Tax=Pseudomonas TaxID=286 RepID=UPI001AEAF694|nr:type VI secretion system-associated protein TagF [Pseudomonas sp. PvP006]MBP1127105.1 type VI secretion system protein ImpM [Pseudomonas sp. PvP025]MDQ0400965.1 type VI secretion system protein ImpM [Pseudomonas sp. PvP006]